jgi:hypothetical protein
VQDRGVEVVDVNRLFHRLDAVFVGGAMHDAALDAGAGQPGAERDERGGAGSRIC